MVESILVAGRRAWLKQYPPSRRGAALAVLDLLTRAGDMTALRPPPHRGGEAALRIELRRIGTLRAQGVPVPEVLGHGQASLLLGDCGETLSSRLRDAADDAARIDVLARRSAGAIADAHDRGAYLGQPLPRNIVLDRDVVGFLDFEEDPLEVMGLEHAKARDWLLFASGMSKHYAGRPEALAEVMKEALDREPAPVRAHVHAVSGKLQWLARAGRHLGTSARALAQAIVVSHSATMFALGLAAVLLLDWFSDGDLDLLRLLG